VYFIREKYFNHLRDFFNVLKRFFWILKLRPENRRKEEIKIETSVRYACLVIELAFVHVKYFFIERVVNMNSPNRSDFGCWNWRKFGAFYCPLKRRS
jgi:hypothetical protein